MKVLVSSVKNRCLGGAEISAFDPTTDNLFVTSEDGLQVIEFSNPSAPTVSFTIDARTIPETTFNNTEFTSVSVSTSGPTSIVAAALPNINPSDDDDKTASGDVLLFDGDGNFLQSFGVGSLPDMVTFVPETDILLVANEGETAGGENEPAEMLGKFDQRANS